MRKMILKTHNVKLMTSNIVRIDDDVLDIIKGMQLETGLNAKNIVSECVRFASENYEVKVVGGENE